MKQFDGFSGKMYYTPIPNQFFSELMADIDDIGELKVTLHVFRIIYAKKGRVRFVTVNELLGDAGVIASLHERKAGPDEALADIIKTMTKRGTIIRLDFERQEATESLFFINTEQDRNTVEQICDGRINIEGLKLVTKRPEVSTEPVPDIFALYEENVGMLNPMVADLLKEAEQTYPASWIRDAIKEAVSLNKRNWKYISKILENWAAEGRNDGTHRRDTQKDPEKFRKQKYDHLIKR